MTIKPHRIIARKNFSTNNGAEVQKGTIFECRIRTYHTDSGSEVSDIHILKVIKGGTIDNSYAVPDTVFCLNAGAFRFIDTADRIDD